MAATQTLPDRAVPLLDLHRELGARVAERQGTLVPTAYAPVAEEVDTVREACGLVDRSWIDCLEIVGADRERFLSGMVTCEVRDLAPEGGAYGFLTSRKGGVVADFGLLALEDRFWLELPPGRGEPVAGHLGKYVLADRVELRALDRFLPLTLVGEGARKVLREATGGAVPPAAETRWGHAAIELAGASVRLSNRPLLGAEAWTVWTVLADGPKVLRALLELPGVLPVGYDALDTIRLEAGIAWWGRDYDESNLPQETGLDEALNFTKGCYLGQEVVARLHYRGGVARKLCGLEFDGDEPPPEGTELLLDGRPVGKVGSVAVSPTLEGPVGLAMLQKRAFEPGTRLDVAGGGEAEVTELPLVD